MNVITLCLLAFLPAFAFAGPERIEFPLSNRDRLLLYNAIERPDRKPAIVRFMYVNPEAARAAKGGEPAPYGTVLVMEDRKVKLDEQGRPVRGPDGRFVPTDEVLTVFVQQKGKDWGEAYSADKRNGDWDYAWFNPDGTRRANAKFDGCFACHMSRAGRDFNFTFSKWVLDGKP
jgi:hypothetical protein